MRVGTDWANLITQSLQVYAFIESLTTIVGYITAHGYISKAQSTYLLNQ